MIYTPLVQKAIKFAYRAHHGQTDQSGIPYIFHPFAVAEMVCASSPQELFVCAALLHDVLEDTRITIEELQKEFPKEVAEAVMLLTHQPGEDYYEYVGRLKDHPMAKLVKLMDLKHNMDMSRLDGCSGISDGQKARWEQKYKKALEILGEEEKYVQGT